MRWLRPPNATPRSSGPVPERSRFEGGTVVRFASHKGVSESGVKLGLRTDAGKKYVASFLVFHFLTCDGI